MLSRHALGVNLTRISRYSPYSNHHPRNKCLKLNNNLNKLYLLTTLQKQSSTATKNQTNTWKWKTIAKTIKYIRIPILVLSVYGIGYQQGIVDYSRNPKSKEEELLITLLSGMNATPADIRVARDGEYHFQTIKHPQLRQISQVGHRIIKSAQKHVDTKLRILQETVLEQLGEVDEDELLKRLYNDHEGAKELMDAKSRLDGKWQYVLVKSDIPNAFVSEVLPNRIFVTTAMLETFIENEDEMALILGHEVSHLLYGHVSERNSLQMFLLSLEVLLLSLDPTEGFLSLAFMTFLSRGRAALNAANSRDHERMADELGIKLAAMACYDTSRATDVFRKMHRYDVEMAGMHDVQKGTHLFDSHPPTLERYENLVEISKSGDIKEYEESGDCSSMKNIFRKALKAGK